MDDFIDPFLTELNSDEFPDDDRDWDWDWPDAPEYDDDPNPYHGTYSEE